MKLQLNPLIPLRALYQHHYAFLLTLLLFLTFRLLAIMLFRPGGFIADFSDFDFYYTMGQMTAKGYVLSETLVTAYPPLFPALVSWIFELSSRVPPWADPRLFFHVYLASTFFLFEVGNLILIYRLWGRLRAEDAMYEPQARKRELPAPILYALLFVPAYTMLGWFEAMPLFFMLLGLELLLAAARRRPALVGSAIAAALGTLTKLTPALLLPLAVRWLGPAISWRAVKEEWFNPRWPRNLGRPALYILIFAIATIAIGYPFVKGNPSLALSSVRIMEIRPPWQSIWALMDGHFGFGFVPIDGRNLAGLETRPWDSQLPWGWITAGFVAIYAWLFTRPLDWRRCRTLIAFAGVSLIWLFLYSKGWSPQFLIWIAAIVVLLLPTLRGMALLSALTLINFVESTVFVIMLPEQHWILWGTVLLRTALLIALALDLLGQVWPRAVPARALRRVSAVMTYALFLAGISGFIIGAPGAADAYAERRLAVHPCREAVALLKDEAEWPSRGIATAQVVLWQQLYPWLRQPYEFVVLDDYGSESHRAAIAGQRLSTLAEAQGGEFWWITRRGEDPADRGAGMAEPFFDAPAVHRLDVQALGACQIERIVVVPDHPQATADVAGGPMVLHRATLGQPTAGGGLHLVLYWEALAAVEDSYTVFTQLFNPAGEMIAQQDNPPVTGLAPTHTWPAGTVIRDPYRLELPSHLPPGEYRLLLGLYDEVGRRPLTTVEGRTADHLEISLRVE